MLRSLRRRGILFPHQVVVKQPQRFFFFGNNKKSENPPQPDNGTALVVPQTGDNAPRLGTLLAIPVRRPVFPGLMSAAIIKDERTIEAIIRAESQGICYLGTFLRTDAKDGSLIEGTPELITRSDQLHKVGTFVQIQSAIRLEQGLQLLLMGHRRVNLEEILNYGPPLQVRVNHWKKPVLVESTALKAYRNELILAVRELFKLNPLAQEHSAQWLSRIELSDSFKLADVAAAITTADSSELQGVLEASDPEERLSKALELVANEKEIAKLQQEINRQVEEKMTKSQREYFLREQLKSIKKELGLEKDDKDDMMTRFAEKVAEIETRNVDPKVLQTLKDEMQKLGSLERNSPEFNVTRSYLEWLLAVPWNVFNKDRLDLAVARETLDAEHYGLDDIKKRILEFIAVGKLRGTVAGKIVCFIGPPGVGKTSIAKSISKSLDRSFFRFSVGGLTDIAEIKGHRRTYIGAMPGKPIQSLKSTGCSNPLILIDEVDKIGKGQSS
jgi:Lon-like ATP-dependent protease